VVEVIVRQVHDLPPLKLEVSEHQAEVKGCPVCGQETEGVFPDFVNHPVQYGPMIKGLMVYLVDGQLLPLERSVELLDEVFGASVSEGTVFNTRAQCFEAIESISTAIATEIQESPVAQFDETGMRVNGKLWWLHDQALIEEGLAANPPPPPPDVKPNGCGWQWQSSRSLNRLHQHQSGVLGFMRDFSVPFDNNQAERDLRMMKLKQKISGGFRSAEGAKMFCGIRGYLSTLRKQGIAVLDALVNLFMGNLMFPAFTTE